METVHIMTDDVKQRMIASKHANLLSKMKWEVADPYLDVEIENGKANRAKAFITLREYKDKMISGITQEQMREAGVSKHLLQFLSNFCQGKYTITKEQFETDYIAGLDLDTIAEKYKVTREDLTPLRQLFKIQRIGGKYTARKATEKPLTQRQREIIIGSLMGDAKSANPSKNAVGFGQCEEQILYAAWKYEEMRGQCPPGAWAKSKQIDKRTNTENISWRFYTKANTEIEIILKEYYGSGEKQPTRKLLDEMTALSIAVWYMDDGRTDWKHHVRVKNPGWNMMPEVMFCTESFSCAAMDELIKWSDEKFGIKTRLRPKELKNGTGHRLVVEHDSVIKFFELIKPHIIPSMMYKVDYDSYCERKSNDPKI